MNIEKLLIESLNNQSKFDAKRSLHCLDMLANRFDSILLQINNTPELLNKIASRSFSHPNGFDRIDLVKFDRSTVSLRLHIWWQDRTEVKQGSIHDHAWDFASKIITGELKSVLYNIAEKGDEYFFYRCNNTQNAYKFSLEGQIGLREIESCIFKKGSSYYLKGDCLHSISPIGKKITSTLVLQGEYLTNETRICTLKALDKPAKRKNFTADVLSEKLQILIDKLRKCKSLND